MNLLLLIIHLKLDVLLLLLLFLKLKKYFEYINFKKMILKNKMFSIYLKQQNGFY